MSSRELITRYWAAMRANDWSLAASFLTEGGVVDWPCSGERIVGRHDFAAIQAGYPSNTGRWTFDVHRMVVEGDTVVSEVTVSDGEQAARVVVFSEVDGEQITRQMEYWPVAYDPQPGREGLTQPIERVP
ncbi:MAG: nuclear transport factor 2 family protein [Candidatus Dormibacteria bacterium]